MYLDWLRLVKADKQRHMEQRCEEEKTHTPRYLLEQSKVYLAVQRDLEALSAEDIQRRGEQKAIQERKQL